MHVFCGRTLSCVDNNSSLFSHDLLTINWTQTKVTEIKIKNQNLRYLTMDMLPPYSITGLYLENNLITTVNLHSYNNSYSIKDFYLDYNPIIQFIAHGLNISTISLCRCQITSLNPQNFYFPKHTQRVLLNYNLIREISETKTTKSIANAYLVSFLANNIVVVDFNFLPKDLNLNRNRVRYFHTNSSNLEILRLLSNGMKAYYYTSHFVDIPKHIKKVFANNYGNTSIS